MRKKMIITGLMISTLLLFTGCNNQIDETVTTTEVDSVIEDIESESTDDSIEKPTEEIVDTTEEAEQQVSEEVVTEEEVTEEEVTEETETEEETEETEVVEEETTESSDEQLVSSLNLPEDERQFYMQQFGLSSEELDNLTVTRLYELIDGYLNSLMDGGGSSSGGGSSTGGGSSNGGSDNSGSNGGDEGNHESNPWGLPVGQLNPDDGSLPGNM